MVWWTQLLVSLKDGAASRFFRGGGRGVATASMFGYRQLRRARLLLERASGPEGVFQSLAGDLDGGTGLRQSGFQLCRSLHAGCVVLNSGCTGPQGVFLPGVCIGNTWDEAVPYLQRAVSSIAWRQGGGRATGAPSPPATTLLPLFKDQGLDVGIIGA